MDAPESVYKHVVDLLAAVRDERRLVLGHAAVAFLRLVGRGGDVVAGCGRGLEGEGLLVVRGELGGGREGGGVVGSVGG